MACSSIRGCAAACALLLAPFAGAQPPGAAAVPGASAIAMHGAPALPPAFAHLPYADPAAQKGGRLVVGFQGTFDSLNPFNLKAGSTAQGLNLNVFEPLMTRSLDEPFTLYGLIAQSIETDEARSFAIFHIDPRARFSDGTPVTADDVAFTFDLLKTRGRPQQRAAFELVKSISTPDALTVRYDFPGLDDREMPLTLALMPVLPRHAVDVAHFDETTLATPIGSGPYRIAQVKPGDRMVLRRNPDYWARDLPVRRGQFNFDEIDIEYFRDPVSMFEAFRTGIVDFREEKLASRWITGYDFAAMRDGRAFRAALPIGGPKGMDGFVFNLRHPLFADVRVREALGMLFDFEWINANLLDGLYVRTKSFFDDSEFSSIGRPASDAERKLLAPFPGAVRDDILNGAWTPPATNGTGQDRTWPRRALALLTEAGYQLRDGILERDGTPLTFEIMVETRAQERLALNYAESLGRIGVQADVRLVDEVQFQRRRQNFNFDVMIGDWPATASPGSEERARWGSGSADQPGAFNLAGVKSPAVDALIDAMLAAPTEEDFVTAVRAFDRVLLSGFYVVPLYHADDDWIAASTALDHPTAFPKFGAPIANTTLETWWRKAP